MSPPPEQASALDPQPRISEDSPNVQLVKTLREQIDDLLQQVSQLNGKLVQSYDRVSDLEDTLHVTSSNLRSSTLKISDLEIERAQHLSALNTGLLVEKSTITTELTRLMERVAEETNQRGMAENAKEEIERDLDDLSANLFNQANTMVAEARYARAMSERKTEDAELALRSAEEVVSMMQSQMQGLTQEKEQSEKQAEHLRQLVDKGKWVPDNAISSPVKSTPRLSTSHVPYQEFLLFNSHVRSIRSPRDPHPSILTMIQLPFLSRLQAEDSDPTLRLDFAPSLNFLTRRSVQNAIYTGQLNIEPIPSNRLTQDPTMASSMLGHDLTCALCGRNIFPRPANDASRGRRALHHASASWASTSRFLKVQAGLIPSSAPSSPVSPDILPSGVPAQTYVFRVSLPPAPNQKPSTTYPLCFTGLCLNRLRSTCQLWHLARDIINQVWNEPEASNPAPPLHPRSVARSLSYSTIIGRPASPNAIDPNQRSNDTAATPRRSVADRVWGALSASSRSTSPTREPTPDRTAGPEPSAPPVPPRRLPPISITTAPKNPPGTSPPPLPQRRHPPSPTKSRVESEMNGHATLEDTATVRSTGTREESGLLTPASESDGFNDGFKTPPDRELASPINDETDTIHAKAIATELPASRPTSPTNVATMTDMNDPAALNPPTTDSPSAETPRAQQPTLPPAPAFILEAPTVSASPPPLPRRAAARGLVASPAPSRTGSPSPAAAPAAQPAASQADSQVPKQETTDPEIQENASAESAPSVPESKVAKRPAPRSERAFSVTSASSQYSSEVNDVVRKDFPIAPQKPPMLPPRRSQTNNTNGDSRSYTSAINGVDEAPIDAFTDGSSWEEKTWKELVRLREDMFWARMGAVRGSDDAA